MSFSRTFLEAKTFFIPGISFLTLEKYYPRRKTLKKNVVIIVREGEKGFS
jgi:hypothetical protein